MKQAVEHHFPQGVSLQEGADVSLDLRHKAGSLGLRVHLVDRLGSRVHFVKGVGLRCPAGSQSESELHIVEDL